MMEHSTQFYQLNEVINKYKLHLSDVINFWIGHEIPLYIKMEGVSCKLSCIIRDDNNLFLKDEKRSIYRYRDFLFGENPLDSINLKNLIIENSKLDVIHGNDIYQSELSCQFTERQFRHERGSEVSYIKIGREQLFYNGFAYGYWRVKAGPSTRFVTGKYKIANTNPLMSDCDSSAFLNVYGMDEFDCLIFNNEVEIDGLELYISSSDIEMIKAGCSSDISVNLEKVIKPRTSKQERRALYILLHEICKKKNLQSNASSMANILTVIANNDYGKDWEFDEETIRNWLIESKLK